MLIRKVVTSLALPPLAPLSRSFSTLPKTQNKVPGIESLKDDHNIIKHLFVRFENEKHGLEKKKIVNEIIRQLSIHSSVEERVLYPSVSIFLKGASGVNMADHAVEDHHALWKLMDELQSMDHANKQFDKRVHDLIKSTTLHMQEEEQNMFPALASALTGRHVEEFGLKVERARSFALTKPHPYLPNRPPINEKLTPIVHLVDKLFDSREFPEEEYTAKQPRESA